MFAQSMADGCGCGPAGGAIHGHHDGTFYGLGGIEEGPGDPGIGHERVMTLCSRFPTRSPTRTCDSASTRPTMSETQTGPISFAQIGGRGPKLPERSVDYQDVIASWEVATGKALVDPRIACWRHREHERKGAAQRQSAPGTTAMDSGSLSA